MNQRLLPRHIVSALAFITCGVFLAASNLYGYGSTGYPWNERPTMTPAATNWHNDWTEEKTSPKSTWTDPTPAAHDYRADDTRTRNSTRRGSSGAIYVIPNGVVNTPYTPSVIVTPKPATSTEPLATVPLETFTLEDEEPILTQDPLPDDDILGELRQPEETVPMNEEELPVEPLDETLPEEAGYVEEEQVNRSIRSQQPKTGDNDGILLGIALLVGSAASAFAFTRQIRKRRDSYR